MHDTDVLNGVHFKNFFLSSENQLKTHKLVKYLLLRSTIYQKIGTLCHLLSQ